MNSEQIIQRASDSICAWTSEHNAPCLVYVKDGEVRCREGDEDGRYSDRVLYISRIDIVKGLTHNHWLLLGSALLNLYNKEKACQKSDGKSSL